MTAPAKEPLYLDFAASTPPADEVVEAMLPWLRHAHANPHSEHFHGRRAARAIDDAREAVAALIGGQPESVVFTSGATEANNLALKGLLSATGARTHLWLADTEHKSLREPARYLSGVGVVVTPLAVLGTGLVDMSRLTEAWGAPHITPGVVAIAHGNNEIGTLQPLPELAERAHAYGHLLHVDAAQSAGRIPLDVEAMDCDLMCVSSHKLYGPGGIGALYVAPAVQGQLEPQLHGGGQEGGLRSGTVPAFLAVGFGTAAKLARQRIVQDAARQQQLATGFLAALSRHGVAVQLIGHPTQRLPGHLSLRFPGVDAEDLLARLAPALSASTGAACAAGELRSSHVLRAVSLDERTAGEVIRFTLGRSTREDDIEVAAERTAVAISRIQEHSG
ncbi:cysteine desulfurase family protein [Pseudoxanthomonas sp. GM95]|uniref:cysteine desulfurase family protein n=1 Tax=Pseudoxanthomonas sp. GM95 TaxID=1881043 RepID=UPI001587176A|nr:cysteine desulfurase family protein [Pseudoxanthomonas sp. GM95]